MIDKLKFKFRIVSSGCWEWLNPPKDPSRHRPTLKVSGRMFQATHIFLTLAGRPRPSAAHQACHTCDNYICVNPKHLFWATQQKNMDDYRAKGFLAIKMQKLRNNPKWRASNAAAVRARNLKNWESSTFRNMMKIAVTKSNKRRSSK